MLRRRLKKIGLGELDYIIMTISPAGAGVILSAISAMKVPMAIMIAAKTIMLRIRKTRSETADFTMPARKLRPAIPG